MADISKLPVEDLNEISVNAWSQNAQFWDAAMGKDGNEYFRVLELPALERLVQPQKGEVALDLGTGTGLVARWLASHGCDVTASDASPTILNFPRNYDMTNISLERLDVTRADSFERLIHAKKLYSIITMNMVIMDVPTIDPLAQALPNLLYKNGRFVATVPHPAFCSSGTKRHLEIGQNEATGRQEVKHSIQIARYLNIPPVRGEAIAGQPVSQLYFDRSFSELFAPFFKAGLVLDGLEEVAFPKQKEHLESVMSYKNMTDIPLILAFRFRQHGGVERSVENETHLRG